MRLPELQREFPARMLTGDDANMPLTQYSRLERRDVLMGVYEQAYGARQAEVLEGDYDKLHAAIGQEAFLQIATDYAVANPSRHPNARFFGAGFPAFLLQQRHGPQRPGMATWPCWNGPWAKYSWQKTRCISLWKPWRHWTPMIGRT